MAEDLVEAVEKAARLIVESNYVVALGGRRNIRGERHIPIPGPGGGIWTRIGEPSMRGYQQFLEDPAAWWQQQLDQDADPVWTEFRAAIDRAVPNDGHYALAALEGLGALKFTITQNVDNLHHEAGSKLVAEIHGNRIKLRCIRCELRWHRDEFDVKDYPPICTTCGGIVKSDTVMFGEPIPRGVLAVCFQETDRSDCMLTIGTSATVYPAASFPESVKQGGGCLIEANPNETPLSGIADVVLRGPTGHTLPELVRAVKALKGA